MIAGGKGGARQTARARLGRAGYVHTLSELRDIGSLPPRWKGVHDFRGVVAVEREPVAVHHWMGLCKKHGIILTWPKRYDETLNDMLTEPGEAQGQDQDSEKAT